MAGKKSPPDKSGKKTYDVTVNGKRLESRDQLVRGRELLQLAEFDPASDHVLIQLTKPGSKSIGLDEEVDLSGKGREEFMAFGSDRIFTFTVDERGYEWGAGTISEPELRAIAAVAGDKVLILEREERPDKVLDAEATVNLAGKGTERLRTGKRLVTVFYGDDLSFELERRVYTGAELAGIFGVPENYKLDLVKGDSSFDEIADDEKVKIRDGMRFVSHPPCGQSS